MDTKFSLEDCVFTTAEAADHLRVSRSFLYGLIREKKLRLSKLGTRSVVLGSELKRFLAATANSK